jgi:hypothetical protein
MLGIDCKTVRREIPVELVSDPLVWKPKDTRVTSKVWLCLRQTFRIRFDRRSTFFQF